MTTQQRPTPGEFMSHAAHPVSSNTEWGMRYAMDLRKIVRHHAENSPRNLQVELGPSELGTLCDRQVAGKFAGVPHTNHIADPWPSIMGVAGHTWMEKCFTAENERLGYVRYLPEFRVYPHDKHPGTGDLYDIPEEAVVDWKFLGDDSLSKLTRLGPPRRYVVQLLLYGRGFRRMGLPVRRIVLVAWPRTRSTMDRTYVWDYPVHPADDDMLIEQVFEQTEYRRQLGEAIRSGTLSLRDIPATPDDQDCYFCPFFRAEAARDPAASGCPGHHLIPGRSNTTGP